MSLTDLTPAQVSALGDVAARYGQARHDFTDRLQGTRVGLVFTAPSTRTRTSFWSAATTLGCDVLHLGGADLQVSTGETWGDTGLMLANYLDVVVARTNGPQHELLQLAEHVPATVNALTDSEHPTQSIADLCALREHFGSEDGLRLAYFGHVNNTIRSLAQLVCMLPFDALDVYCPEGEGFSDDDLAAFGAITGGGVVRQHHDVPAEPTPVDVVYTTRWSSMGAARSDPEWLAAFTPFAVTEQLVSRFSGPTAAVVMHDLPAVRGQEVTSDLLDGVSGTSLVRRQAYHKASAAAAALLWSTGRL